MLRSFMRGNNRFIHTHSESSWQRRARESRVNGIFSPTYCLVPSMKTDIQAGVSFQHILCDYMLCCSLCMFYYMLSVFSITTDLEYSGVLSKYATVGGRGRRGGECSPCTHTAPPLSILWWIACRDKTHLDWTNFSFWPVFRKDL